MKVIYNNASAERCIRTAPLQEQRFSYAVLFYCSKEKILMISPSSSSMIALNAPFTSA